MDPAATNLTLQAAVIRAEACLASKPAKLQRLRGQIDALIEAVHKYQEYVEGDCQTVVGRLEVILPKAKLLLTEGASSLDLELDIIDCCEKFIDETFIDKTSAGSFVECWDDDSFDSVRMRMSTQNTYTFSVS